jgi:hypothetical protein
MPDFAGALGASKAASALLVLFIPSKDRCNKSIDQRYWVKETLNVLAHCLVGQRPSQGAKAFGGTMRRAESSCLITRW